MTMTLYFGAKLPDPGVLLSQDERIALAAKLRQFGYILLAAGAVLGVVGVVLWAVTGQAAFLVLLATAAIDILLALRQFAAARRV